MQTSHLQYGILHNRKAAGTALKEVIDRQKQRTPTMNVQCFGHAMTFPQFIKEYPTAQAVFFIREPISRFVSGFYSRLRQGQPRYFHPWNSGEKKAFTKFTTPNELAECLSHRNIFKRWAARKAMRSIGHVRHTYVDFFGGPHFLVKHLNKIAYIGHQPNFNVDLAQLRTLLHLDADIEPPTDAVSAHRNPDNIDKYLSKTAIANLKQWYQKDYEIYDWCLQVREKILTKSNITAANAVLIT